MTDIQILFEDPDIIVVDKPAGMIVNRADTTKNIITLQDWIEEKYKISKQPHIDAQNEFIKRSGIVHRLDKETSGILIVAKTEAAFINLQSQFKSGGVHKTYTALVHGMVKPMEGEINVPIGRLPWNRMRFGVLPEGRESKTVYKVIDYRKSPIKKQEFLTYIEVYPQTGRTHQIRVHMQYLGFPLFGDPLYTGRKSARDDRKVLDRHFLHASKIVFTHPITGATQEVVSPLSLALANLLDSLEPNV